MDIFSSPRALTTLWASLMSDNEVLMTNFLATGKWNYETFAAIMASFHTTAVFNAAVGKGKGRDQHYSTVVQLILTTAKDFWLRPTAPLREVLRTAMDKGKETLSYPFSCAVGPDVEEGAPEGLWERAKANCIDSSELVVLKKRLGGFYLLYVLYFKQPYEDDILIPMTLQDYDSYDEFEAGLAKVFPPDQQIWNDYRFMLNRLKVTRAFFSTFEEDKHDIEHSIRFYLNTKRDKNVELLQVCKQIQDEHSHDGLFRATGKKFVDYAKVKAELMADLKVNVAEEEEVEPKTRTTIKSEPTEGPGLVDQLEATTTQMSELLNSVMTNIKNMSDVPIFSRSAILGNETTERLLIGEASKRKTRLENKEKKSISAQRYDRDIFGSQKEDDDEEGSSTWLNRRGRSQAAKNLWQHYIPENFNFEAPTEEELPFAEPPSASEESYEEPSEMDDPPPPLLTIPRRGRGRPRKTDEMTPSTGIADRTPSVGKRGRGRPRKTDTSMSEAEALSADDADTPATTPKRKLGRPRKTETSMSEEEAFFGDADTPAPATTPKRKMGRPRKTNTSMSEGEALSAGDADTPATTPKRKLGRPRKMNTSVSEGEALSAGDAETPAITPKRKMGRPRKTEKQVTSEAETRSTVCRMTPSIQGGGWGRPRKSYKSKMAEDEVTSATDTDDTTDIETSPKTPEKPLRESPRKSDIASYKAKTYEDEGEAEAATDEDSSDDSYKPPKRYERKEKSGKVALKAVFEFLESC